MNRSRCGREFLERGSNERSCPPSDPGRPYYKNAAAFREATIDCLPSLAETEAGHLTARWNNCTAYWSALTGAAARENPASLRRIQLYGLQLAAAARLEPGGLG